MRRDFKDKKGPSQSSGPFFKPSVQAKLAVGKPGDQFEQEADNVADKVVNKTGAGDVQKAEMPADDEKMQKKPIAESISGVQKKDIGDEEKPMQKAEAAPEEEKPAGVQKAEAAPEEEQPAGVQKAEAAPEEEQPAGVQKAEAAPEEEKPAGVQKAEAAPEEEKPAGVQKAEAAPEEEKPAGVQKAEAAPEEEKPAGVQKAEAAPEEEQPAGVQKAEAPTEEKKEDAGVQKAEATPEEEKKEPAGAVQQKSNGTGGQTTQAKLSAAKGKGSPLSGGLKRQMESGFGADLSGVRIHTDTQAEEMSSEMNAQAFTHGNDVYFNKGKFDPNSKEGQHLIAHELTHTIQQEGMVQKPIQRHMQKTYPWDGYVSAPYSAALRKVASKTNWIADIPKGTRLTVIGNSGNWLNVRVMVDGIQKTGYMSQELVSLSATDGVANEMGDMVGDSAKWTPSGPSGGGRANTFVTWAEAKTESDAPPVSTVTTINCWEMVLLAAYRSGAITWKFIHDLYLNTKGNWGDELPNRLTSGPQTKYNVATKTPKPKRGELVFFDGASHVALATGSGDQIYTFWPPPNIKNYTRGTIDVVKVSSISALYTFMKNHPQMGAPKVTIGTPIW